MFLKSGQKRAREKALRPNKKTKVSKGKRICHIEEENRTDYNSRVSKGQVFLKNISDIIRFGALKIGLKNMKDRQKAHENWLETIEKSMNKSEQSISGIRNDIRRMVSEWEGFRSFKKRISFQHYRRSYGI